MLDKTKPYGQVHGNAKYAFEQNNKLYNAQFEEVDKNGKLISEIEKEPETKPAKDPRAEVVEKLEAHTVSQLKDILNTLEVHFDDKTKKADLIAMVADEKLAS